jgi:hypothetical protein
MYRIKIVAQIKIKTLTHKIIKILIQILIKLITSIQQQILPLRIKPTQTKQTKTLGPMKLVKLLPMQQTAPKMQLKHILMSKDGRIMDILTKKVKRISMESLLDALLDA